MGCLVQNQRYEERAGQVKVRMAGLLMLQLIGTFSEAGIECPFVVGSHRYIHIFWFEKLFP